MGVLPIMVYRGRPKRGTLFRLLVCERVGILLVEVYKRVAGLDVATCGVANATRFYSLATNFSRLVARLAPRFFDLVLKFLIEFNTLILSCSRMKPMKSCSILLLATLFTC